MANEQPASELQALYDEYNQRQKAAKGVLTVLKGKSSALTKIQKALDSFAIADSSELLDNTLGSFAFAKESMDSLVKQVGQTEKQFTNLASALKNIGKALNTTPIDVVKLDTLLKQLRKLNVSDDRIMALLPSLEMELNEAQQTLGIEFGMQLREGFAGHGLEVAGSAPTFEVGRFEIAVDFRKRKAAVNYGKENVSVGVSLSVEALLDAYEKAVKTITERAENLELWLAQLYVAWEIARKKQGSSGSRVNIVSCYYELVLQRQRKSFLIAPTKSSFVEYTRAQFAFDLHEATYSQQTYNKLALSTHSAIKAQTDESKSIWVVEGPSPYSGRYIGDIEFKPFEQS